MRKRTSCNVAVLSALLSLAPAAALAATGSATLTNFHIQLVDLDPGDGIEAAVTFRSLSAGDPDGVVLASASTPPDSVRNTGALGTVVSAQTQRGSDLARAATTAGSPQGSGPGPGATSFASASAGGSAFANAFVLGAEFTLTPHSRLVLTADASITGVAAEQPGDQVFAGVTLVLFAADGAWSVRSESIQRVLLSGSVVSDLRPQLSVSWDNVAASSLTARSSGYAEVNALAAAVPEPAPAALWLSGLAWLCLQPLRRRCTSASTTAGAHALARPAQAA